MNLMDLSAGDLAAQVRKGKTTPQAALADAVARAKTRNPAINAICLMNPKAQDEADTVTKRLAQGEALPLAGVPVLIKDNIWVKGLRIAQGSRLFADHIAPEDAEAVKRLRQAGAVVLGIATCSEFACKGATLSPLYGITRNPLDPTRTSGGSSGGSVSAVAAGIVPLALGTDAGGSTRRPPAHTGLIGMKPSQDLIPYGPGFDEPVWGVSVICPITRDMDDLALVMHVLTGIEVETSPTVKLAASQDFCTGQALDAEVAQNFSTVLQTFSGAGVNLSKAQIDWQGIKGHDIQPLQYAGLAYLYGDVWKASPDLFDPALGAQIDKGLVLSSTEVAAAHQASHKMRVALREALDRHGFIATPTTPCAAWPAELDTPKSIGGKPALPRDHAAFTPQINHAGVPALSIPCGTNAKGLPLGLQLIAPFGQDAALIGLAQKLEPILKEIP